MVPASPEARPGPCFSCYFPSRREHALAILWLGLMALTIGLVIGVFGQKVLGQFGPSTLPPAPAGDPRFQVPLPPPPPGSTTMPPSVPSAVREPAPFPLQTATGPDVVPPQIPAPAGFSKQETQQVSATNATVTLPPGTPSLPPNAAPYSPNGPRTYVPNGVQPPLVGALDLAVPGNDARPGRNDSTVSTEWIGPTQVKVGQPITCRSRSRTAAPWRCTTSSFAIACATACSIAAANRPQRSKSAS